MRLICPNCAAQYEIEPALIPEGGRDVQCSSCGSAWFVAGNGVPASEDAAQADPVPANVLESAPGPAGGERGATDEPAVELPDAGNAATPTTGAPKEAVPEEEAKPLAADAPAETGEDEAVPPRRELDPRTRAILLEEAERESAARRGERKPLEFGPRGAPPRPEPAPPPRQGRPIPSPRKEHAPRPPAPVRPVPAPDAGFSSNPLLPDVAEINSTLSPRPRPRPAREEPPEAPPPARRSGVGLTLSLLLLLALALTALYFAAPAIGDAVPALEPLLSTYVGAVDDLRATLADL